MTRRRYEAEVLSQASEVVLARSRSGDGLAIVTAIRELASFEFAIFLVLRLGGGVTFKTFSSCG